MCIKCHVSAWYTPGTCSTSTTPSEAYRSMALYCIVYIICTKCHAGKPLAVNPIITYRFYIWNNNLISYKAVQYDVGVKHKELVAILQKKYDVVDILKYA